jgi:hypothetical protein
MKYKTALHKCGAVFVFTGVDTWCMMFIVYEYDQK